MTLGIAVALAGCGGGANDAPEARFVAPHGATPGPFTLFSDETAELDASASSDPEGDALNYRWSVLARPISGAPLVEDPAAARTRFAPGWQGRYVVMLTVDDGRLADTALRALQVGPTRLAWSLENPERVRLLDAGPARCTTVGTAFRAQARRLTDVALVSTAWRLHPPEGSTAALAGTGGDTPQFVPDLAGRYVLQWFAEVADPAGGEYVKASGTTVDAVPVRAPTDAGVAPGGMQVTFLGTRRTLRPDGFVQVEVDLRLRNPTAHARYDAPLHLMTDDGTEVLPVGFRRWRIAPGDAGVRERTHRFLLPDTWTPLLWEYQPLSTRPPPPPDVELPPPLRLLWCAAR